MLNLLEADGYRVGRVSGHPAQRSSNSDSFRISGLERPRGDFVQNSPRRLKIGAFRTPLSRAKLPISSAQSAGDAAKSAVSLNYIGVSDRKLEALPIRAIE